MHDRRSTIPFSWPDEAVALLKKHWADGLSCSQITAIIGNGVTRNAVIGKVTRLRLGRRTKIVRTKAQKTAAGQAFAAASRKRAPKFETPPFETAPTPEEELGNDVTALIGSVLGLNEHTCKWPIGDPLLPGFGFCGRHSMGSSPYCEEHHKRGTYRP